MRIYHKRNFAEGLFFGLLFLVLLITMIIGHRTIAISDFFWAGLCLLFAIVLTARSLSSRASEEDRRDEEDERHQLIEYKVALLFEKIIWNASLILTIIFIVLFAITRYSWLIWPLVGSAIVFNAGFIILLTGSIYYERNS
ncbi:MAG: hypothetical protein LKI80_10120 [Sporolactobacillus sp.]|jgi:Ca2+/Na+ antiporter|nr:hypothetical protein [Sporolactobacillus sp.]